MRIVNLTPHPVTVAPHHHDGGAPVTYPPQGTKLRLDEGDAGDDDVHAGNVRHHVVRRRFSAPATLPEPQDGTLYIVSLPLLMGLAATGTYREDLVAPDAGKRAKRDGNGQILQVPGFIRLRPPFAVERNLEPCNLSGPYEVLSWHLDEDAAKAAARKAAQEQGDTGGAFVVMVGNGYNLPEWGCKMEGDKLDEGGMGFAPSIRVGDWR